MSTCPLCRVSGTPEHLESGWHKFNHRLFSEGKMPIPRDNYDKFERHRHENGDVATATPSPIVPTPVDNQNVNKWHWEELNLTRWATSRMNAAFNAIEIAVGEDGKITFNDAPKYTGDAYVNSRKGRTFAGYEMKIDMTFQAEKGEFKGKGTCHLPEVSADVDDYDYEIIDIKIDGNDCPEKRELLDAFRKHARTKIRQVIKNLDIELRKIAKNPTAFNPDEITESITA